MKKSVFLFLMCSLLLAPLATQAQTLSAQARISLLTIAPGEELYSGFGHTGIRVMDPVNRFDRVYNYGTFDFQPPIWKFYLNFLKGHLIYRMDTESFREFDYVYHYYKRTYTEQVLNLDSAQKQHLFQAMEINKLPENRQYPYDFFFDNCATRPRDLFSKILGDSLKLHTPEASSGLSFRDMLGIYLVNKPWEDFGIDLILGAGVDKTTTYSQQMFLPDFLASELAKAEIIRNGKPEPFTLPQQVLYEGEPASSAPAWYLTPAFVFSLLLGLTGLLTWRDLRRRRRSRGLDFTIFLISGLAGLIIFLLWFATEHKPTAWNLNAAWLLPSHLYVAFLLLRKAPPAWAKTYLMAAAAIVILLIVNWFWLPQELHAAFLPWMGILLLRMGVMLWGPLKIA
ncbi:MAG: DUF4105 domain-containing protein [Bacteroidetes bacterium]|nr:MAG: DUF4105 domain-containing protein [Bacteroidota bacterium]